MNRKKKTTRKTAENKVDNRLRYLPEFSRMAEEYIARNGWDAVGLARLFGVSDDAIHKWLANRSDFKLAVETGKARYEAERPDAFRIKQAEDALFMRVMGHEWQERKVVKSPKSEKSAKGGNETEFEAVETITSGVIAPDVSALKYYLNNRCSERWRDRQEVNISGVEAAPIVMIVKSGEEGGNGPAKD
jgi:hypothetical protein